MLTEISTSLAGAGRATSGGVLRSMAKQPFWLVFVKFPTYPVF